MVPEEGAGGGACNVIRTGPGGAGVAVTLAVGWRGIRVVSVG